MIIPRNQFAASYIALMPAGRQDSLFEIGGIGAVQQHVFIVISLYHQVIGGAYIGLHLLVGFAAIGGNHKPLTIVVYHITDTLGRVVVDSERIDCHVKKRPLLFFLKIAATGFEFLAHTIVAVYSLVYQRGGIDR